jgi:hypothetical protein
VGTDDGHRKWAACPYPTAAHPSRDKAADGALVVGGDPLQVDAPPVTTPKNEISVGPNGWPLVLDSHSLPPFALPRLNRPSLEQPRSSGIARFRA